LYNLLQYTCFIITNVQKSWYLGILRSHSFPLNKTSILVFSRTIQTSWVVQYKKSKTL